MSETNQFSLGSNFTVHVANRPDLVEGLSELAAQYKLVNKADLLQRMIEECRKAPAKAAPAKIPREGFFASIDPMDQEMVDQLKIDMWRDKKIKNQGILAYFATLHKNLKEKTMFLIKPPKGITRKLLEITEPLIDGGEVQSEGQYVSIVLRDHFKALNKPKPPEKPKVQEKLKKEAPKEVVQPSQKEEKPKKGWTW